MNKDIHEIWLSNCLDKEKIHQPYESKWKYKYRSTCKECGDWLLSHDIFLQARSQLYKPDK